MAPILDEDLLAHTREVRKEDQLQVEPGLLESIRAWLQSHEADSTLSATHTVLENYPDWWSRNNRRSQLPGLAISGDDLEDLYQHVGRLHDLRIPLTLQERRTPLFRFFQDIEAWGSTKDSISSDRLVGTNADLTRLIGTFMGKVFPPNGNRLFLDAAVFDTTGVEQTKGLRKTSLRLVWPSIIVDQDRAITVQTSLVHQLTIANEDGGALAELQAELQTHNRDNAWYRVFSDGPYGNNRPGVRMPLCDSVSPLPLRAPEKRPFVPVGMLRFSYTSENQLKAIEWLCKQEELNAHEWVKLGTIRVMDATVQLSRYEAPAAQNRPAPKGTTKTGRIKVRTVGGSDGAEARREPRRVLEQRAGTTVTVKRRLAVGPDLFCEKMERQMGQASMNPDGAWVWRQPNGEAHITMYAEDRRITVVGLCNQVRSLLVTISQFCEAEESQKLFWPQGLPSAAYAPAQDTGFTDGEVFSIIGQLRYTETEFNPEGQGELQLQEGAMVTVLADPEAEHTSGANRWVYGRSEATQQVGWFPLSHTKSNSDAN